MNSHFVTTKRSTFLNKRSYKIEVLSPIHIGTGNRLFPIDYIIDDGRIKVISVFKLIEKLPENLIKKYKVEHNLIHGIGLNYGEILREAKLSINNFVIYEAQLIDNPTNDSIYECIKTFLDKTLFPFIPGSEIKGFIRTAIIYKILKEERRDLIEAIINKLKSRKRFSFKDTIEKELLGSPKDDILKAIKISDAYVQRDVSIREVYVANTTRRKPPEFYEVIEPASFTELFCVTIDKRFLKRYSGCILNWKRACYEFSADLIKREISYWKDNRNGKNINGVYARDGIIFDKKDREQLLDSLEEMEDKNTPEEPILRIGKLTGYFSHSIGMLLADDHNLKEFGKQIAYKSKPFLFPLTRRLTLDNQTLGWCKLIEGDIESSSQKRGREKEEKASKTPSIEEAFSKMGARVRKK